MRWCKTALRRCWPACLRRGACNRRRSWTPACSTLLPPSGLKGIEAAAQLLAQAIAAQQRICIVADYDCDGATACAVAVRGLRMLGAQHVSYEVPDRVQDGYGLSPAIARARGRPGLRPAGHRGQRHWQHRRGARGAAPGPAGAGDRPPPARRPSCPRPRPSSTPTSPAAPLPAKAWPGWA